MLHHGPADLRGRLLYTPLKGAGGAGYTYTVSVAVVGLSVSYWVKLPRNGWLVWWL